MGPGREIESITTPLPPELQRRFDKMGLSRSDQDQFRDDLWEVRPTESDIKSIADALNPWEVLGELQKAREKESPSKKKAASRKKNTNTKSEVANEPEQDRSSLEGEHISSDGDLDWQTMLQEIYDNSPKGNAKLLDAFNTFKIQLGVDSKWADPEQELNTVNYGRYQAFLAELANRDIVVE